MYKDKLIPIIAYTYLIFIVIASLGKYAIGVIPKGIHNGDKIGHAFAYAVFVIIWAFYFRKKAIKKYLLKAIVFCFLFGCLMEVAQWGLTTYRQFDLLDVLANSTGIVIGSVLIFNILKKRQG